MYTCPRCRAAVRDRHPCPTCGPVSRPGRSAAAALLGLVASPLFACQEMYGVVVTGPPEPQLRVTPSDLVDLGDVAVGAEGSATVEVQNIGASLLELQAVEIDPAAAPFLAEAPVTLPLALEPGERVDAEVTFAPTAAGAVTATLRVTSDDPDEPEVTVPVQGVGTE